MNQDIHLGKLWNLRAKGFEFASPHRALAVAALPVDGCGCARKGGLLEKESGGGRRHDGMWLQISQTLAYAIKLTENGRENSEHECFASRASATTATFSVSLLFIQILRSLQSGSNEPRTGEPTDRATSHGVQRAVANYYPHDQVYLVSSHDARSQRHA